MKQFENVWCDTKRPQFWEDEVHVYVLLSQEETQVTNTEGEQATIYVQTYCMYTHEEWRTLLLEPLKNEKVTQLDQSVENLKKIKVALSKSLLEEYYKKNPVLSYVHDKNGAYYSITSSKQAYLTNMLSLVEQAEKIGKDFTPVWNASGEQAEDWTANELRALALEIAQAVYPQVQRQQEIEKEILALSSAQEILDYAITY